MACSYSCRIPEEREAALLDARAVFVGRVVAREETRWEEPFGDLASEIFAEVAVEMRWKGPTQAVVAVHHTSLCGSGEQFEVGEAYLVWAHAPDDSGAFYAGACSRTARLDTAADDLEFLDASRAEEDGCQVARPPSSGGAATLHLLILGALAVIGQRRLAQ